MLVSILLKLLLLSTFEHVRAGGGGVGVGEYSNWAVYALLWGMAVGIYIYLYLWLTVGELRLLDGLVTPWGCAPRW